MLTTSNEVPAAPGAKAQAVIRPERVRVEAHGSAGVNRVPALVERVVYLGAATQVMLRLATGESLQAVAPNEDARGLVAGHPGARVPARRRAAGAGRARRAAPADAEAEPLAS